MSYEITQKLISLNRSGESLNPKGMVAHSTADKGATANNEFNYFNTGNRKASAHAFIDWTDIIETIPDNEVAWGSGYTSNHRFLQVELCEPSTHDVSKFNEVWNRAVWYFANKLLNVIKVNSVNGDNLLSHAEVSNRWHETNHQDPLAFFAEYGKSFDDFRAAVQEEINNMVGQPQLIPPPTPVPQPAGDSKVSDLQRVLNRLKIRDGKGNALAEDGITGNCTREATKRLQNICGLTVDGVAGPNTWNAINAILSKPLLKVGSTGIAVNYMQYRVGTTYDGIFGNNTKAAVIKFQSSNGLSADGIVGNITWSKLIG